MNWNWGTTDYSPQVSEFASMDPRPDVIFSAFIMPDGGVFARQLHAAGVNIPIYATDGMDDPTLIEVGGEGAELVTFTTHGFPTDGSKLKWFYDECVSRGFDIQNIFFGLGGEAVEIVRHAIETAGSADPAAINAQIKEIEGLPGGDDGFDHLQEVWRCTIEAHDDGDSEWRPVHTADEDSA